MIRNIHSTIVKTYFYKKKKAFLFRKGIKECVDFKIREGACRGVSGLVTQSF